METGRPQLRKDLHLIAIPGEPDRLLETVGRDAEALCGKEIKNAKCVARMDELASSLPTKTVMICNACLQNAVKMMLRKQGKAYLYGVAPAEIADLMNAGKEEE